MKLYVHSEQIQRNYPRRCAPQTDHQLIGLLKNYVERAERGEEELSDTSYDAAAGELQALLTRLTSVIHKREDYYKVRLEMITEAIEISLWEMDVYEGIR